jgi:hypothetical protein
MNRQINVAKGPPKALSQARLSLSRHSTSGSTRAPSPTASLSTNGVTVNSVIDPQLLDEALENAAGVSTSSATNPSLSISQGTTKRKRTAWIYRHMAGTDDMQAVFVDDNGKEIWPCRYCFEKDINKSFKLSGGTLNIENHLRKHNVFEDSPMDIRLKQQQLSIQESMESAANNTTKKRRLVEETALEKELDGTVLESLYVKWISTDNQALRLVECPEFRAFLTYLNSNVNAWLPSSHSTVGQWVLNQYTIEKERIKLRLYSARYKIHISCDIWTSPNTLPVLGVVAHYISDDNELEHAVLAMKEIQGSHEGENIAPVLLEVLEDWGIITKLGWIQMDNASNNDTLLRALSRCTYCL